MAAIEAGDHGVSLSSRCIAADILGVPLFGAEDCAELARLGREGRKRLAPMPVPVDRQRQLTEPDDDL